MAEWFKFEVDLIDHPKIRDLGEILGIIPVYAAGHMASLWGYVFKYFKSGVIQGRNIEYKIAVEGARWPGVPQQFIDAIVDVRLLHRTSDGAVCDKCFPPNDNGQPRQLEPDMYWIHDWKERISGWLYFEERKRIVREQNAYRWRKKRTKDATETNGKVARETPSEYKFERRGLRAAPRKIKALFDHALESVTSREKKRDVTQTSRVTSRTRVFKPKNQLTNMGDTHAYSDTPITHIEREIERPSSKDNDNYKDNDKDSALVSSSLNDREEDPKAGTEAENPAPVPSVFFPELDPKDEIPDAHPNKKLVAIWWDRYLELNEQKCPEDMGRLARAAATWRKRGFSDDEIIRRMTLFIDGYHEKLTIGEFQKRFIELENGPLKDFKAKRKVAHGQFDKREFETVDDFS